MGFLKPVVTAAVTGNFDGDAAGTVDGGTTIPMNSVEPGSLSAEFTVDAETNTITLAGIWQISDDGSTWLTVSPENNAATVVLATGTAGADAAVTKVLSAPAACYGARFARAAVQTGVTTGTTSDTYSIKNRYARPRYH